MLHFRSPSVSITRFLSIDNSELGSSLNLLALVILTRPCGQVREPIYVDRGTVTLRYVVAVVEVMTHPENRATGLIS